MDDQGHTGPAGDHGNSDGHGHAHSHAPATFGRAFALGIVLNSVFVLAEVGAGLAGHSVALLADAGHNVGDVLGLLTAWLAHHLSQRAPTARFTFGLGSSSMLAALFNAVLLLVVVGGLSLEAVQRLAHPQPVAGGLVMLVAGVGVVVNGGTALLFAAGRHGDLNIRGAYLHMLSDAFVAIGVLVAGGIILLTGWLWLDPLVSLLVNLMIVVGTWGLLRDSLALCLAGVPPGIEAGAVQRFLLAREGVSALHDLHIWSMSTTQSALSAHLVMPAGHPGDAFLVATAHELHATFAIGHTTLQIETSEDRCELAAAHPMLV